MFGELHRDDRFSENEQQQEQQKRAEKGHDIATKMPGNGLEAKVVQHPQHHDANHGKEQEHRVGSRPGRGKGDVPGVDF